MSQIDNGSIIKTLIDSITELLTQLVIKYESLSKDVGNISQSHQQIRGQVESIHDIRNILLDVQEKTRHIENTIVLLREIKNEFKQATSEAAEVNDERLGGISEELYAVHADLINVKEQGVPGALIKLHQVSEKLDTIERKIDNTEKAVTSIGKLSDLLRKPIAIIIALIALWLCISLIDYEMGKATKFFHGMFFQNTNNSTTN